MYQILIGILIGHLTMSADAMTYHLITQPDLEQRLRSGYIYEPSLESEGFIHNATLPQVVPAANRHFRGKSNTLLLEIEETLLDYPLRYDYVERHNEYFPHIYGPINWSAVVNSYSMLVNADGSYALPLELSKP